MRRWNLMALYGMTQEDYDTIFDRQGGRCAICRKPPSDNRPHRVLEIDHDHATNRVRGLLCGTCNKAIGLLRDDAGLLRAAADYVKETA